MLATAPGCELDVERGPDWLLIKVKRLDWDPVAPPPLADDIWSVLQRHFTYRMVLELDEIDVLNSYLIGQLVQLYKRVVDHEGVMRLCGLAPYNRRVLHTCRLDDLLSCYPSREEAVLGCHQPSQPR